MRPVENRVLLKVNEAVSAETRIGSIVMKETKPDYESAEVLAVGDKVIEMSTGDKVLIYPEAGKKFKVDGEEYRVVTLSEIIVVL